MNTTLKTSAVLVAAMAIAVFQMQAASAATVYTDGFESYSLGDINAQGPWTDFGGAELSEVTNAIAHTGDQSLQLKLGPAVGNPFEPGYGSDALLNLPSPPTSGQWTVSYWQYIPDEYDGATVMFASEQVPPAYDEGQIVVADNRPGGNDGAYRGQFSFPMTPMGAVVPIVFNQWAQYVMNVDLGADTAEISYNGTTFYNGVWDVDTNGTGALTSLEFWTTFDNVSGVFGTPGRVLYIDDISVVPEPSTLGLMLGAIVLLFRRRK